MVLRVAAKRCQVEGGEGKSGKLARIELQEAFRGLLTRLPGLRMAVPMSDLEFHAGQAITSMRELPVTWDDV